MKTNVLQNIYNCIRVPLISQKKKKKRGFIDNLKGITENVGTFFFHRSFCYTVTGARWGDIKRTAKKSG